jgi:hypothetical protein
MKSQLSITRLAAMSGLFVAALLLGQLLGYVGSVNAENTNDENSNSSNPALLTVTSTNPKSGPKEGQQPVQIVGTGFVEKATVAFDTSAATVIKVEPTMITVTAPPHAPGKVDVTVTNPDGHKVTLKQGYEYTNGGAPSGERPPAAGDVRVKDVYRLGYKDDKNDGPRGEMRNSAGLGDIIVIQVENLQHLSNQAKCIDDATGTKKQSCQEQEIALYLEGRKIEGLVPESGAPRPEEGTLQFHLQRSEKSDEAWADLFGAPPLGDGFFKRPTEVSVGLANAYAVRTDKKDGNKFNLVRIREYRFWLCTIGLVLMLGLLYWLARDSDILRDIGPPPAGTDARGRPQRKTFSLARLQMATWFFLVVASLLYIWQITGAYNILTASVLGLIGIGAGTFLGAAVIDKGQQNNVSSQLETLKAEKVTLESEVAALTTQTTAAPPPANLPELQQTLTAKQKRLSFVNDQIAKLMAAAEPQPSRGLLMDILSDTGVGVSFHRFQMFIWTLVLVVIFIVAVWNRLSMPEFPATLLALMGISNGTYLGFKIPESQT